MYMQVTEYDETNISGTQPQKNMIKMGNVDTSDLMIITRTTDLSFKSPKLKWASWIYTTPYLVKTINSNQKD